MLLVNERPGPKTNKRAGTTHLVTAASVVLTLPPGSGLLEILTSLGQGLLELHDLLDLIIIVIIIITPW